MIFAQQPCYENSTEHELILAALRQEAPLIPSSEVWDLRYRITQASHGHAFLLQAGDCAERFADAEAAVVEKKIAHLQAMKDLLREYFPVPVIPIGRIAGQYAKPRTNPMEIYNGQSLLSFRGDIVHDFACSEQSRKPDPKRLWEAYEKSRKTLGLMKEYTSDRDPLYTSHEALLLSYEEAWTRWCAMSDGRPYNAAAHMVWIGERTRALDGPHVAYASGILNPVGIKLSAKIHPEELVALIGAVNPKNEDGRVVLIPRLGAEQVMRTLPQLLGAVKEAKLPVTWLCDPMHGNSFRTVEGYKTRQFDAILKEILLSARCHAQCDTVLGGLHLEVSANDVTECLGGAPAVTLDNLPSRYESACDPRLNARQSLQILRSVCLNQFLFAFGQKYR